MKRDEVLRVVAKVATEAGAAVFTGNGYNARALCALDDRAQFFYMVGSMGLCPTLAAGFARRAGIPVIAVEGDGNALMGLSGFPVATNAAEATFIHLVLDNARYETTGGQQTLSPQINFLLLALGAGYDRVYHPHDCLSLEAALEAALQERQRMFIYVTTEVEGRVTHPRVPYHPCEVAQRFRKAMSDEVRSQGQL